jgi:cysteine desulfurase
MTEGIGKPYERGCAPGGAVNCGAYIGTLAQIAIFYEDRTIPDRVYLDHAATSPLRPEAKAAMDEGFGLWANPSSPHAEGRKARAALEDARERIKRALEWEGELIFTSGASEALWIALNRAKVERRIVSAVEHDAVFRAAPDAAVFTGAEPFDAATLLAVQHVNSETGTINPVAQMAAPLAEAGALLLSDCAQSAGKLALPEADLLVISAHKFGGPIGVGALLVRDFNLLEPVGGHERGYRQGTENLPGALGMAAALETGAWATTRDQRAAFAVNVASQRLTIGEQVDYIVALTHPSMSAQALLIRLDAMGFAVSAGSACSSGTLKKSRVLDAFGVPDDVAARTIRVSMGWSTTVEDLERFSEAWASLC